MSPRRAAVVLAGLVFLVGVLLGLLPHSVGDVGCGSPWSPSVAPNGADLGSLTAGITTDYTSQCASTLSMPRVFSWVLVGVGGAGLVFVGLMSLDTSSPVREREPLTFTPVDEG